MHTYTTYTNSNENDNKNNNSVEINIDGKAVDMTTDEYKEFADKITEENEMCIRDRVYRIHPFHRTKTVDLRNHLYDVHLKHQTFFDETMLIQL